jgi:hypothetical protein
MAAICKKRESHGGEFPHAEFFLPNGVADLPDYEGLELGSVCYDKDFNFWFLKETGWEASA